jgi:osmotically-inducible protein OsmY
MDPATDAFEIDVAVRKGVVALNGDVESIQEKMLCETVAKGVNGVVDVQNNINVDWPAMRKDEEIKAEIQKALEWDVHVDAGLIDVGVEAGKVALSGVVGSYAEKQLARSKAWVHGVRSVKDDDLKVERWKRDRDLKRYRVISIENSDAAIELAIRDACQYDPRVADFKIEPRVTSGMVTLRGTVDNARAKRAAAQNARNTSGVRAVKNLIKVRTDTPIGDTRLEKRIRNALRRDPYIFKYEIVVDVQDGVARLSGSVDSYYEKSRAESLRPVSSV